MQKTKFTSVKNEDSIGNRLAQSVVSFPDDLSFQIIEANPSAIVLVDAQKPDMPIIYANPAFEKNTGFDLETVRGINCRFLHRGDPDQPGLHVIREALSKQCSCKVILRNYRKDGSLFWNEIRLTPIFDTSGKLKYYMGVQNDVTERIRASQARSRSERRYRSLFNQSNDAVFLSYLDGYHLDVNQRATEMFGYSREELLGMQFYNLIISEEQAEQYNLHRKLLSREVLPVYWRKALCKDGKIIHVEVSMELVHDEADEPLHIQTIVRDITHRVQIQKRELELKLEQERRQLTATFIEHVSHEFRTPLTSISTSNYLLARADDDTKRTERAAQIEQQVQRISHLIDMQLWMLRLDQPDAITVGPVRLNNMVKSVCERLSSRYGLLPALDIVLCEEDVVIQADRDYLAEALNHLLDNAYQFTPPRGNIKVRAKQADSTVRIDITDSGPGITPEDKPYIFNTFWRKDRAHTTPGFGLGLPIAQRIIKLHGGSISVHDVETGGVTFQVLLPV